MSHSYTPVLAAALAVAAAPAQSFAVQLTALNPLTVQATNGGPPVVQSLPAGPLAASGNLSALASGTLPTALAQFGWSVEADGKHSACQLNSTITTLGAAAGSIGANEVLIDFVPAGAPAASLVISTIAQFLTPGVAAPTTLVDLGNDGSIDLRNPQRVTIPVPAGQGLTVRVVTLADVALADARMNSSLRLELLPDNDVYVQETVARCMNPGIQLVVDQVFRNQGIEVTVGTAPPIGVIVFGLNPTPVLLPIASPVPCLLLPSQDFLAVVPPFSTTTIPIALPSALRPVTFHVQAVAVSFQGAPIGVSPGYTIFAQ